MEFFARKGESKEYDANGACYIERFLADCAASRGTSTNGTLSPTTQQNGRPSNEVTDIVQSLEIDITTILNNHGLPPHSIGVHLLTTPETPTQATVVAFLDVDQGYDSSWRKAADQIQTILNNEIARINTSVKIAVELRGQHAARENITYPIGANTSEGIFLLNQCTKIEAAIKAHCKHNNMIAYLGRGPPNIEPVPTVLISIVPLAKYDWLSALRKLRSELDSFQNDQQANPRGVRVNLEFTSGLVYPIAGLGEVKSFNDFCKTNPMVIENVSRFPQPGASIGPRNSKTCGTMGPFVVIWDGKNRDTRKACFLTCFYCVETGVPEAERSRIVRDGIALNGNQLEDSITIEYPAPDDAERTLVAYGEMAKNSQTSDQNLARANEVINIIKTFRKSPNGIGKVIHASGHYRSNPGTGHRYDWALVEMADRNLISTNTSVQRSKITELSQLHRMPITTYAERNPPLRITEALGRSVKQDDWALKHGRSSGSTCAEITAVRSKITWTTMNNWETFEDTYVRGDRQGIPFAINGDSGAAVHSSDHKMIGMVTGFSATAGTSFVTPFEIIARDVKEKTGLIMELA